VGVEDGCEEKASILADSAYSLLNESIELIEKNRKNLF